MFWDRFVALCAARRTSPTAVVKALGLSGGSVTKWKRGSIPNDTTVLRLADYLGVPAESLSGEGDKKPTGESGDELEEYLELLKNRPEMKMLFSLAKNATREDVEQAVAVIEALRKSHG